MTTTVPTTSRPAGVAAVAGGVLTVVLGAVALAWPTVPDPLWFGAGALAAGLFVVGVLGLRRVAPRTAVGRHALTVAAVALTVFGLAHLYVLVDPDTAFPLFSLFLAVSAAALVVSGVAEVGAESRVD